MRIKSKVALCWFLLALTAFGADSWTLDNGNATGASIVVSGAVTGASVKPTAATPSRVAVIGADGTVTNSAVTTTTLGYLDATSGIQAQIDAKAPIASPTFTGTPAAPTASAATSTTQLATTAHVHAVAADYAPLASPTLTGTPAAPTAAATVSTTQIATTANVHAVADGTQTGTHASPSTANPLSPTWTGPMHTVWYGATGTINLPAAAGYTGKGILIYNTGAFTITIDSNASEVIVRDGTVQTGGVNFTLSTGAGNYVCLYCDGARWVTLGFKGTLTLGT